MDAGQLEVLGAAAGGDVDDPRALLDRDLVPIDHAVLHLCARGERVERPLVAKADERRSRHDLREPLVGVARGHHPLAVLAPAVLRLGVDRGRDVRRERPGCRRPDHERLARPLDEREPDGKGRVGAVLVDARLGELVLRERGAAARAPLRRAVTHVDPVPLVHPLEEPPDVLDVRVAEREVVVSPVHPLAEADRPLGQRAGGVHDHLAAPPCELGQAVRLDVALGVEPELTLDSDLDPEALTVEAVLIALVVAPERLVALEDVLQRPTPGGVDAEHHPVRGHRPVDEAEPRPATVLLAQAAKGLLPLPKLEDRTLERVVIRLVRQACEHADDSREGFFAVRRCTEYLQMQQRLRKDQWLST